MKSILLLLMTGTILLTGCLQEQNPLLQPFTNLHQATPFDKIKTEHFLPAFTAAMQQTRDSVNKIINNTAPATFQNTIEAYEYSGELLNTIASVFFNLNSAHTNKEIQGIAQEVQPQLTQMYNDFSLNPKLFARIKAVYDQKASLSLTPEQQMLLEKTYLSFTRNGANLPDSLKQKYRDISEELSKLSLKFQENVLEETNGYELHITDSVNLKGLPAAQIQQAAETAKSKNKQGWIFTLHQPSYAPFLKYAENRELRKQLYTAYNKKGAQNNQYDNQEIIKRITELRLQKAQLLGYKNFAQYVLEERMAKNENNVNNLLNKLLDASLPVAKKEYEQVQAFAKKSGADFQVQPYDWSFYTEKLQTEQYSVNEELLRPYFELNKVTDGIFLLANKLYGLRFVRNDSLPVYHPDVQVYEVFDKDSSFLALFYADFFPRESKRGGAWMTEFRGQYKKDTLTIRPHISIVCNFTKPTPTEPSLLTFYEFTTYLHEFGHALHGMLANTVYPSLSGTAVYRDFVEFPSHFMENWAVEKEYLDLFAEHYKTKEKMPAELIEKVIKSKNYLAGYLSVRQLSFGLLDMAYHSLETPITQSVADFEKQAIAKTTVLPTIDSCMVSTSFAHIFSGGYAAGYYSYKWSETIDADAFTLFKEKGIFDVATATALRENVLSKGGTENPEELYRRFRGQDPDPNALLRRSGFIK